MPRETLSGGRARRISHEWWDEIFCDDLLRDKRVLINGGGTGLGKPMVQRVLEPAAG